MRRNELTDNEKDLLWIFDHLDEKGKRMALELVELMQRKETITSEERMNFIEKYNLSGEVRTLFEEMFSNND